MSVFNREETAWSAWTKSIEKFLGDPGSPLVVQSPTIMTTMGVKPPVDPKLAWFRKYLIGDSIPFYGNRNPNAYILGQNKTVSLGYQQYLGDLNREAIRRYVNSADQADIDRAFVSYDAAQRAFTAFRRAANSDWKTSKSADPALSREAWEETYGPSGYRPQFNLLKSEVQRTYSRYKNSLAPYPQVDRIAQSLARLDLGSGTQIQLPTSEDDLTLGQEGWDSFLKTNIELLDDWKNFWTDTINADLEITQSSIQSSYYNHSWSAGGSVSYGFFSVGGGASGGTVESHLRQGTQSVKFKFENIKQGTITRGTWYDSGLVSSLPYNKWVPFDDYWGPNGVLNLIPAGVIIARGVTVEITTSQAAYDSYKNWRNTSGSAGFSCGPFRIGGSGSSSTSWGSVSDESGGTTIRLKDTSGRAYLFAVVSQKMDESISRLDNGLDIAIAEYARFSQEENDWVAKNQSLIL